MNRPREARRGLPPAARLEEVDVAELLALCVEPAQDVDPVAERHRRVVVEPSRKRRDLPPPARPAGVVRVHLTPAPRRRRAADDEEVFELLGAGRCPDRLGEPRQRRPDSTRGIEPLHAIEPRSGIAEHPAGDVDLRVERRCGHVAPPIRHRRSKLPVGRRLPRFLLPASRAAGQQDEEERASPAQARG
jgi:hypothetical protein